jgi:hypothetical protein
MLVFQCSAWSEWRAHLRELGSNLRERSGVEHLFCIAPDALVA